MDHAFGDIMNQPDAYTFSPESRETIDFFAEFASPPPPPLQGSTVASTSAAVAAQAAPRATAKCSQCKETDPNAFPIRLATLEPYLVCKAHDWYWSEAVKAKNWAPESVSRFSEIIEFVKEGNGEGMSWMVEGQAKDRDGMVGAITALRNWIVTPVWHRKSRATPGLAPPPVISHRFALADSEPSPESNLNFQLDFTHHPAVGRFIIALKPEKVGPVVRRPVIWKANATPASPKFKKVAPTRSTAKSKRANDANENVPPARKPRMTKKRAKEMEKEAQEARRASEKTTVDQRTMESDLDRLRKAVTTHNETSETQLNSQNLEQLLHVAAAVFLSDSTNPASSRNLTSLLADQRSPLPSRTLQITPQKRASNHPDVSPGSQFDELDSSEAGEDDQFRGRGRSEDIEEEEELSEDETDDEDEDEWLTGLVRGELGPRGEEEELEDGEEYAW